MTTSKPHLPTAVASISRTVLWKGFFRMDELRLKHERFDGTMSAEIRREIFERGAAVCVLPYDPVRDEVVLIRQFLPGAWAAGLPSWPLQVIAGMDDKAEGSAEATARREAQEEAGLKVTHLERALTYLPSPGGSSETLTVFVALIDAGKAGGVHGVEEEQENIRVEVLTFDKAMALVDAGEITPSPALVALLWLARHRDRLRNAGRTAGRS